MMLMTLGLLLRLIVGSEGQFPTLNTSAGARLTAEHPRSVMTVGSQNWNPTAAMFIMFKQRAVGVGVSDVFKMEGRVRKTHRRAKS
jgi:hypothetical protein